jgi:hypothetical protein
MPPKILLRQNAINWALGSIVAILHGERLQQSFILSDSVHSCTYIWHKVQDYFDAENSNVGFQYF